jgi:ABC-type transport system substrate-binding protein
VKSTGRKKIKVFHPRGGIRGIAGWTGNHTGILSLILTLAVFALPAGARTRPHYGGTLHVETEGEAWQANGLARSLVLDGLTERDAKGALEPALAVEWSQENIGHRWEFKLRPGVHFQDGNPLTALAVAAALNTTCGTKCPWATLRAVGSSLVFLGDAPMPNLPELLANDAYRIAESGAGGAPVGTGPFQFGQAQNGVVVLAANDSCWSGRPFVDTVEIREHRAVRDQWLDLSVGRADVVEVPAEQMRQAQQQRLQVLSAPAASLLVLQGNEAGPMGNPRLREAVALAIDRNALSNVIFQKQSESTASLLPGALTGYAFLFPAERDLGKALELRGGQAPGQLMLATESGGAMLLAAQRIALNLREAGFNVQAGMAGGGLRTDMTLRRIPFEGGSQAAALESVLRTLGSATPVTEQNPAGVYRLEHEFLQNRTAIPLLYLPRNWAVGSRVRGLRLGVDGRPLLAGASVEDAQ